MARFSTKIPLDIQEKILIYNKNPTEIDWRLPENRKELFFRYFAWRVSHEDLDQRHWMRSLCKNYDFERKLWFGMVFGMTYRSCQTWAYTETFPYIHDMPLSVIEDWHVKNWKRTTYGSDARYNKGHFVRQCESIKEWLKGQTLTEKIGGILVHDTQTKNFYALFEEIKSLFKYGRMTTWLAMQALHDLCDLPIDPGTPILNGYGPHNDSSMQSIWNGLCALENTPEKMVGKYGGHRPDKQEFEWFQETIKDYCEQAQEYYGEKVDSYRCETIWCMYKRLFNTNASKEYAGHSSGDHAQWYLYYRENWDEIDWSGYREAARSLDGLSCGKQIVPWKNALFGQTGLLINMHDSFSDLPDVYKLLDIGQETGHIDLFWTDDGLPVPENRYTSKFTFTAPIT